MIVVRACFMVVKIRVILYCGIFLASTVRDYWDIGYAAINLVSIICGTVSKFTTTSLSKCRMKLRNPVNQKKYSVEFVVVKEDLMPLLGKRAAEQMNLMVVNYDNMKPVHKLTTVSSIVIQY